MTPCRPGRGGDRRSPAAGSRAQGGGPLRLQRSPPTPPPPSHVRHSGLRGAEGDGAPGRGEPGEAWEPPGQVSRAAVPGNAVSASGGPPEERPDLTHRPRAGGGLQEVQLPVLTVAPPPHTHPLPISGSPSTLCITAGTLTLGGSPAPRTCNHSYSGMGNMLLEVVFANKEPCSQTPGWAGSRGRRGVRGRGRAREKGCLQMQFNAAASEAESGGGEPN
ncbi:uncharacterized protein LOC113920508 [Zalophus californianus]|uniref:Uncharacterized protein LOC113920508 n=1 Tax=Zalophus californianus TaxID=9704 RepID=A0A6J2CRZ5_ZALCA|nr:uncharacterized protein LOC113920508 [Zalophus californianus]